MGMQFVIATGILKICETFKSPVGGPKKTYSVPANRYP